MPYIQIALSARLSAAQKRELHLCALAAAALLGKKKEHVMVRIEDGLALAKGEAEGGCAFCDTRVMGAASREACNQFSAKLSADIARIAQTAPACVYLNISELTLCYTDGCLPPGH